MGKSFSTDYPYGIRRHANGNDLAPKSLRGKYSILIVCPDAELQAVGCLPGSNYRANGERKK